MGGEVDSVLLEFHPQGSLATTHESQGSDMGLFGGLLGWEAHHEYLVSSADALRDAGTVVDVRITDFPAFHPNTYRITLRNRETEHRMVALSTGGGIIQVVEIDRFRISLAGDFHETLVFLEEGGEDALPPEDLAARVEENLMADEVLLHRSGSGPVPDPVPGQETVQKPREGGVLLQIRGQAFPDISSLEKLCTGLSVSEIRSLAPVLPIQSRRGMTVPFLTAGDLLGYAGSWAGGREGDPNESRTPKLWELAAHYESARGGIPVEEVLARMLEVVRVMEGSVEEGLAGTEYADRILQAQTGSFKEHLEAGTLLDAGMLNRILLYVSAIMEVKSSMGVVVAAPTAGSCGALPASVLGVGHTLGLPREEMARAMLVAGIVGVFIAAGSTFAAEVCGCQAECGAGSGMAAAALVALAGGSTEQALGAASMALQNTLGLICDPVANRVEVPCLGRNALAAGNALACANMALAGFDEVIPLDEVIHTMDEVGRSIPHQLRCTALGGLSVTNTSKAIEERLKGAHSGEPE
jgi:L-serine dehydratase